MDPKWAAEVHRLDRTAVSYDRTGRKGSAVSGRPIGNQRRHASDPFLLPGASERGRRSATAEGHAGGATGRFDPVGAGQNGTRRRGGVSGRGRLRPAGTGGGRRRGTAAGLTGAKGEGAPVSKLDGALVREHEGGEGRLLPRSSRPAAYYRALPTRDLRAAARATVARAI